MSSDLERFLLEASPRRKSYALKIPFKYLKGAGNPIIRIWIPGPKQEQHIEVILTLTI